MTTAEPEPATPLSRGERRKAATRQKLIDAARVMLAAGTAPDASIQEITNAADVGFGSFYNHFGSRTELFEAAVTDVLEELGALFDRLSVHVEDPALAYAQSTRLTLRLCRSRPQVCAVLVRHGMHYMEAEDGVAPRLLRDLQAGIATGRFRRAEPRLLRAAVSGAVLATLQMALTDPDLVDDAACDQLVEQLLCLLGVPPDEARELAHAPLPGTELLAPRWPGRPTPLHCDVEGRRQLGDGAFVLDDRLASDLRTWAAPKGSTRVPRTRRHRHEQPEHRPKPSSSG